jgi:IS5 family transposase
LIEARRAQRSFGDGFITAEIKDLQEPWMAHVDAMLADEAMVSAVHQALVQRHPQSRRRGRPGFPAEVVLRLLVLKHIRNWSYAVLEREVRPNLVYRDFTRVGAAKMPDAKTMGRWGVAMGPTVIHQIHDRIVQIARANDIVQGRRMRIDTTVVENNIHYPTDSSLLGDGVRVLTRTMRKITQLTGQVGAKLRDRSRGVGLRLLEIARAARGKAPPSQAKMKLAYGRLLNATGRVVGQAKRFSKEITTGVKHSMVPARQVVLEGHRQLLDEMLPRVQQVIRQTKARIFHGDSRSEGKIVSLFEPSAEVIRKGKASKPTEFGKLVKLQEAENQIIVDYEVFARYGLAAPGHRCASSEGGTRTAPGRGRCRLLLRQERSRSESQGCETCLHSQSLFQERRSQARAEEAMVPQRSTMAHRVRGPHQRQQAPPRPQPLPLSR